MSIVSGKNVHKCTYKLLVIYIFSIQCHAFIVSLDLTVFMFSSTHSVTQSRNNGSSRERRFALEKAFAGLKRGKPTGWPVTVQVVLQVQVTCSYISSSLNPLCVHADTCSRTLRHSLIYELLGYFLFALTNTELQNQPINSSRDFFLIFS